MKSLAPADISHQEMASLLLAVIGPRPIAFASTIDLEGNANLAPFSYFNVFGSNPATLIFSPARRGRDNTTKHTYENVKRVPEVVINVVSHAMVEQVNLSSNEYPEGIDEFEKAGFTALPSDVVKPPRVEESPVQLECNVLQVIETGTEGGAGNLVICEVVKIHLHDDIYDGEGRVDPNRIDLVGRLGYDYYVRASGDAIFKVKKPGAETGIGIDSLSDHIKNSQILTGNDLGVLGSLPRKPGKEEITHSSAFREVEELRIKYCGDEDLCIDMIHQLARDWIAEGRTEDALKALLSIDL
jgi:flavin reductase (DIM6/NTAB) family NADH-FMN oxidoreductase RutF